MKYDLQNWTYGAEHEWADWPLSTQLPPGYGRDVKDYTIVNSNGVANDPTGRLYAFGGEINTPPTDTIEGQVNCLRELKALLPMAKVNYRSNLHIHIRVPGLRDDLEALKRVQLYIHQKMPQALLQIEPLPRPTALEYPDPVELEGALRRWRRRRVSHQTLLTWPRLERQLAATTVEEFFANEVPRNKKGQPLWACQPRLCVNLRQLRETDTIEFRHFPGTLDEDLLENCLLWCADFLEAALTGTHLDLSYHPTEDFPPFPPYIHWMEECYRLTVHDGSIPRADLLRNIERVLRGDYK